jgi:hypothetical protein
VLALSAIGVLATSAHPQFVPPRPAGAARADTATALEAQSAPGVIDTVVIVRRNVFGDDADDPNFFLEFLNGLHITTRPYVIEREILLEPGAAYDSVRAEESERNLRRLGLFQEVRVDTGRVDDRLALIVRTRDSWSIKPRVEARFSTSGRLTGSIGATESNLAGTGNLLLLWYVRQADRDGMVVATRFDRFGRTRLGVGGTYEDLSDRRSGSWGIGNSFRSFSDRWSLVYGGEAFYGRVIQYRAESHTSRDTVDWQRRAMINRGFASYAPIASPREYLRVGAMVEVREEEYFPSPDPALGPVADSLFAVPDTTYGLVGAFLEYRRANFARVQRFNGFADEDQDLSGLVFLSLKLAPGGWGYRETGLGTRLVLGTGVRTGPLLAKLRVDMNGLFNSGGLDSGRVVGVGTAAVRSGERQVTLLRLTGGLQKNVPPGGEFDLGFEIDPRLWGPHAFVGTRSLRFTLEHRFYAWDEILSLAGMGFGAFFDYGGAWYEDQDARLGGDFGLSIFTGSAVGATTQTTHFSAGYRFGGGIEGSGSSRWVFTVGSGILF